MDEPDAPAEPVAADGDDVIEGVEPPSLDEQLEHLHAAGWPPQ